ncbi:hypothetical protein N665_0310s0009 [Sinapis alba]|nr:hypothetical protein N665_0310s0009 [Sinapis alba]
MGFRFSFRVLTHSVSRPCVIEERRLSLQIYQINAMRASEGPYTLGCFKLVVANVCCCFKLWRLERGRIFLSVIFYGNHEASMMVLLSSVISSS